MMHYVIPTRQFLCDTNIIRMKYHVRVKSYLIVQHPNVDFMCRDKISRRDYTSYIMHYVAMTCRGFINLQCIYMTNTN